VDWPEILVLVLFGAFYAFWIGLLVLLGARFYEGW